MRVRVASAGTGKTTSLVRRYLELVQEGEPLRRIAGVTFTRNAASELRQRVGEGLETLLREGRYLDDPLGPHPHARERLAEARRELDGATLTTIHGFMIRGLRLSAPLLGLDPEFGIVGEWEARAMMEEELAALRYLAAGGGQAGERGVAEAFERLGERALPCALEAFGQRSLAETLEPAEGDEDAAALTALYRAAYRRYATRLGAARLAPSEVERRALRMVAMPEACARLAARSPRVLVDEFQDVNPLQGRFFEALEAAGVSVEVVGDPKQSIYGFRHADVEVFRRALREGEAQPPLKSTRRHAPVIARFLNTLVGTLAERELGFGPAEAPEVSPAGVQAQRAGRVEIHWVEGGAPMAELRSREAEVLAERLEAAHRERGIAYGEMAVLARSHAGLAQAEAALAARGLPAVLRQARGYYERIEVRDLVHALRVGIDASGLDLAAWLRGPFAALPLAEVDAVLADPDPLGRLEADHPEVARRLERIRREVRGAPLAALKFLIRSPFLSGQRYVDSLTRRQRENVDALLFTVAEQPPGELEVLLDRLELLSKQVDAGDVPQTGEGVQLLTVHGSKGLEWRLVAVFDAGRGGGGRGRDLYLQEGRLHLRSGPGYAAAREAAERRDDQESYRQLYVAVSRARDELIVTGSLKRGAAQGWARALEAMGLAAGARERQGASFLLSRHAPRPVASAPVSPERDERAVRPAAWIDTRHPSAAHPPVQSPSRIREAAAGSRRASPTAASEEPLPHGGAGGGERLPGHGSVVGTLVHYAISRGWSAADPEHLAALRAQEVMFPFAEEERAVLIGEVADLLGGYEALLGDVLPPLAARDRDLAEWPVALPDGPVIWEGVIDRLYRVGDRWILEDYKTDRTLDPARYHFQLAVYREAVRRVMGVTPRARLVDLRRRELVPLDGDALEAAWAQRDAQPA